MPPAGLAALVALLLHVASACIPETNLGFGCAPAGYPVVYECPNAGLTTRFYVKIRPA